MVPLWNARADGVSVLDHINFAGYSNDAVSKFFTVYEKVIMYTKVSEELPGDVFRYLVCVVRTFYYERFRYDSKLVEHAADW